MIEKCKQTNSDTFDWLNNINWNAITACQLMLFVSRKWLRSHAPYHKYSLVQLEFHYIFLGRVIKADYPPYPGDSLYSKIKSEIDLAESFCELPSGEFSMWLGNKFDYGAKTWSGYNPGTNINVSLNLIKEPSSPQVWSWQMRQDATF